MASRPSSTLRQTYHVGASLPDRVLHGEPDVDLRGVVAHGIEPLLGEHIVEQRVVEPHLDEGCARRDSLPATRRKIVQDRDTASLGDEADPRRESR